MSSTTNQNKQQTIKIVAFAGSVREASANAGLIRAAQDLARSIPHVEFRVVTHLVGQLPLFDSDLEAAEGFTGAVSEWREALRAADALLIATPEYNYSVPGPLKNAIDWASRPDDATYSSFPAANKPVAIMGAGGAMGTSRAQYHLRQVGVFLDWHFVNKPEVNVNLWGGKPISDGATGDLVDDATRLQVKALLDALIQWTTRLRTTTTTTAADDQAVAEEESKASGLLRGWSKAELKAALKEQKKRERAEKKAHRKAAAHA
jgi:NAD(P)H-dependent FMN reductase